MYGFVISSTFILPEINILGLCDLTLIWQVGRLCEFTANQNRLHWGCVGITLFWVSHKSLCWLFSTMYDFSITTILYGDFDCYCSLNQLLFQKNDNLIKMCFLCGVILCKKVENGFNPQIHFIFSGLQNVCFCLKIW